MPNRGVCYLLMPYTVHFIQGTFTLEEFSTCCKFVRFENIKRSRVNDEFGGKSVQFRVNLASVMVYIVNFSRLFDVQYSTLFIFSIEWSPEYSA